MLHLFRVRPAVKLARSFSHRAVGIVGMPNIGKSTLFNALTRTQKAQAANYPFCTIEPNVARVSIPDARLDRLAVVNKSAKTVYAQLEFVDIAGLVRGAAEGKGLGNKFLGNIRECSAIVHLLRCFDNEDIIHVEEQGVDPVRDLHTIETELILSDLQSVEKRLENAEKKRSKGAGASDVPVAVLRKVQELLAAGTPISRVGSTVFDKEGKKAVEELQLLSAKPVIYVCNVDEKGAADNGNDMTKAVQKEVMALNPNSQCLIVCARLEEEASGLSEADQKEFLAAVGLNTTGLEKIITASNKLLNLQSYYTVGPTQSVAWSHVQGIAAPQAAGLIHSDFEKGFIVAEVTKSDDMIALGSEEACKSAGKTTTQGKDYIVQDGDIMLFRFGK